jgi:hypothetical protein
LGTFHSDKGELHGITVAVDLVGPKVLVGRVDTLDASSVLLLDVDEHEEGPGRESKDEWLRRAARFGTWKKHDRLRVPMTEVVSVRRLGDLLPRPAPPPR